MLSTEIFNSDFGMCSVDCIKAIMQISKSEIPQKNIIVSRIAGKANSHTKPVGYYTIKSDKEKVQTELGTKQVLKK